MALGASRRDIVTIILRQTLELLLIGLAMGVILALAAGRGASSLLFGLQSSDPITLVGASAVLLGVGLVASFVPVHRASRLDPMSALRYE
jgi:ABC-type antimicrobial peptide transport system permease subunit